MKKNSDQKKTRTIIYIAGSPRSGTTLLDRTLSGSASVFGGGEMVLAGQFLRSKSALCTCGQPFQKCSVWGKFLLSHELPSPDNAQLDERVRMQYEGRGALWQLLRRSRKASQYKVYRKIARKFFSDLDKILPPAVQYIVDSSKSDFDCIWRPAALSRIAGRNVKVIHLYRDVRGVMYSHFKGSNMAMESGRLSGSTPPMITALLWLTTNIKVVILSYLIGRNNYHRVSYADFCDHPNETLTEIARFLEMPASALTGVHHLGVIDAGGHQVYGNRMRYEHSIMLRSDSEWRNKLPFLYRVFGAGIMAGWNSLAWIFRR